MSLLIPSYKSGFARNAAESENPNLWDQLGGLWVPSLGPTGIALRDQSGHKNHGTLTNMDPATDWVGSPYGWALLFDGDDKFVSLYYNEIPSSRPFFAEDQAFSVVMLIYHNKASYEFNDVYASADAREWANSTGFELRCNGNGSLEFAVADETETLQTASSANGLVPQQQWFHAVGTWEPNTVRVYLDGIERGSQACTGFHIDEATANCCVLGGNVSDTDGQTISEAECKIASCLIYNRALIPAEITQLYADPFAMVRLRQRVWPAVVAGAIMSQMQGANLGADLFDGALAL